MLFDRGVLIYNPTAGGGAGGVHIDEAREQLLKHVRVVEKAPTEAPKHATELARAAQASPADLVIVCGGDGTVNEVLQGLAPDFQVPLMVLPGGTANVLRMEVGLPSDPRDAAAMLPDLEEQDVPLGRVDFLRSGESRYFLLMCGAGLDAEVVAGINRGIKRKIGEGAYWWSGFKQIFQPFPKLRIAAREERKASSFIVISKSRMYGGGLVLTPGANLLSDRFEIVEFSGTNCLPYFSHMIGVACGAVGRWAGIDHYSADDLRLEAVDGSAVRVQVDGEVAGSLPARVMISPQVLRLLLPAGYCVSPLGLRTVAAVPVHG